MVMNDTSGFNIEDNDTYYDISSSIKVSDTIYCSKSGPFRIIAGTYFGRTAAIKCLKEEYASSYAHISLLRREGLLQSTLIHPEITKIYSIQEVKGIGFAIIMERLDWPTLSSFLSTKKFSIKQACLILNKICDVVGYIHTNGVIHRDLKPENILINPVSLEIKIIDFGLSHGSSFSDYPFPGGTHGFTAPEQFNEDNVPSPSADIWSIGKLMEIIYPIRKSGYNGFHPEAKAWSLTLKECLKEDPSLRPQTVSELHSLFHRKLRRYRLYTALAAATILSILIISSLLIFTDIFNRPTALSSSSEGIYSVNGTAVNDMDSSINAETTKSIGKDSDLSADREEIDNAQNDKVQNIELKQETNKVETTSQNNNHIVYWEGPTDVAGLNDPRDRDMINFTRSSLNRHYKWQINLLRTLTTQGEANTALTNKWRDNARAEIKKFFSNQGRKGVSETWNIQVYIQNEIDSFIDAHRSQEDLEKQNMYKRTGFILENKPEENS